MKQETLRLIGLAKRAGVVMSGSFLVEQAVHKRKARLILLAEDASGNTKKQIRQMAQYRKIPLAEAGGKEELGHAIGQGERSCLALTDENLAGAVRKKLEEEGIQVDCQGV